MKASWSVLSKLPLFAIAALTAVIGFSLTACDSGGGPFPNDTTTITVMGMPNGDMHGVRAKLYLVTNQDAASQAGTPPVFAASGETVGAGPNPSFVMRQNGVEVFVSGYYFVRLELHESEHTSSVFSPLTLFTTRAVNIRRNTILQLVDDLGWSP